MSSITGGLRSRILGEGLWVSFGQGLTAIGLIVGIRLQTEYIPPGVFGAATLLVGISALLVGIVCTPFAQGVLRFLPQAVENQQQGRFHCMIWSLVAKHVLWAVLATILIGGAWTLWGGTSYISIVALSGVLIIDSARTIEMAFYNGLRHQAAYAGWAVAEAWGRPLLAVGFVLFFGTNAWAVLFGYFTASAINFLVFGCRPLLRSRRDRETENFLPPEVIETVRGYSRPLMPLGVVGWISTLSDRYLIAGILGMHQAGIYAAVYGLISRPFTLVQKTLELTFRPVYFQAVASENKRSEWRLYRFWFAMNTLAGILLLIVFIGGSGLIVEYLLGDQYKGSVELIPYLAIGHLLLITAYNLNSYLYAHQYTRKIFFFSLVTAIASVIIVIFFSNLWGLIGASAACIAYFAIQTILLIRFIWLQERR